MLPEVTLILRGQKSPHKLPASRAWGCQVKNEILGFEEKAHLVQSLPHKHEDLSSAPRIYIKSRFGGIHP